MLRNYLTIAFRNLRREPMFGAISIGGLALSLAACLLVGTFVRYELSYDRFLPDVDRLYRTTFQGSDGQGHVRGPVGLAEELPARFSAVEYATGVMPVFPGTEEVLRREKRAIETGPIFRADSQFFQVFPFTFLQGNPAKALSSPDQAVITERLAERLFGGENPVGQTFVHQRDENRYTVSGVIEDVPSNCHFDFEAVLSNMPNPADYGVSGGSVGWNIYGPYIYLKLIPGGDPAGLETRLRAFEKASEPEHTGDQNLRLQAVTDIHLYSDLSGDIAPQTDIAYLYIAGLVGSIILLLACINYANLGTARSVRRTGEVGIRKALGAHRRQLVGQFLGESMLIACLALPLAFGLARLLLPLAPRVIDRTIPAEYLIDPMLIAAGIVLVVVAGGLSGLYPALIGTRLDPAEILPGRSGGHAVSGGILRRGLIVFQFAISAGLIATTFVVWSQLDFMQERDLGFDPANVIVLDISDELSGQEDAFIGEAQRDPSVISASLGPAPGLGSFWIRSRNKDEQTGETWEYGTLPVTSEYLETVGLSLIAGRFFRPGEITDSSNVVIVTRRAAERFGIDDDPVGQLINMRGKARGAHRLVIGMVEDFHHRSLHASTLPKVLVPYSSESPAQLLVRLQSGQQEAGLEHVRQTWEQFLPYHPISYQFLDDRVRQLYEEERRLARLLGLSALLALGIACLGLLGLAALAAARRRREIAIRKVVGATITQIVGLISREFLLLAAAGLFIAAPLVYLGMERWLQQFAYRTDVGVPVFLFTGGLVIAIALLTVSYQSIKAALTNPAESLRYE